MEFTAIIISSVIQKHLARWVPDDQVMALQMIDTNLTFWGTVLTGYSMYSETKTHSIVSLKAIICESRNLGMEMEVEAVSIKTSYLKILASFPPALISAD